jgi:LPXTG-motif cell wall-anchored protein
LSSFDNAAVNLGIAAGAKQQLSILYIGKDAQLHAVSSDGGVWEEEESPGAKEWPKADDASGRLAVVSPLDSSDIWVYYLSGDKVLELHRDGSGSWAKAKTPSSTTKNDDSKSDNGSDGSDDSTGTDGSSGAKESESAAASPETGMTTGAKAGIGVGVGVGVLALLAAVFFFLRKRRQTPGPGQRKGSVGELGSGASYRAVELPTAVHEPQELSATQNQKYELLGDTRHRVS